MSNIGTYLSRSDYKLAGALILGAFGFTALVLLGLCGFFALCRRSGGTGGGRRRSNNSIVREQSVSIVRGEHPIAFMLPTVSLSEAGSETDPVGSDLESYGYQSSYSPSPYHSTYSQSSSHSHSPSPVLSLNSINGNNIYSGFLIAEQNKLRQPNPCPQFDPTQHSHPQLVSPDPSTSPTSSGPSSPATRRLHAQRQRTAVSLPITQDKLTGLRPTSLPSGPMRIPGSHHDTASSRSSPIPRHQVLSDEEGERRDTEKVETNFGQVAVRLTFRPSKDEFQVKVLHGKNLPTNYRTGTANASVKISLLPSKLPKYCTEVAEDSLDPEFNTDFTFIINKIQLQKKLLRVTVYDNDKSTKKCIGSAAVSLSDVGLTGERELEVREVVLNLKENIDEELKARLADRLELSLRYEGDPGRLCLGVLNAYIQSIPISSDTEVYAKVTLFEDRRVLKAKKTRQLPASEEIKFGEKFSILLPPDFLEAVSCVISLCSKTRLGVKQVLGRTSVGPYAYCSGPGLDQWRTMVQFPGEEITAVHIIS